VEVNMCRFFIVCLCRHWRWRYNYHKEKAWIPYTGLATPHVCPFSLFYVDGIVGYYCLMFK